MTGQYSSMLFSFDGRTNRAPFWLIPLMLLVPIIVISMILSLIGLQLILWPLLLLLAIPLLILSIAVTVRRLHDRGKSGHWAWIYLALPGVLGGVGGATGGGNSFTIFDAISFAITLAYLIDCGFLRGTAGPNDYGPDPIGGSQSPSAPPPPSRNTPVRPKGFSR